MYKLAIFDFDGTMVDSLPAMEGMLRQVVNEYALPADVFDKWRQMIGMPLLDQLAKLLDDRDHDYHVEVANRCRVLTDQMSVAACPLFPGLIGCLKALAKRGVALSIISAKERHQIIEVLEHHALGHYFRLVLGAEDVTKRKPHPQAVDNTLRALSFEKGEAIVIGDSIYDLQMARNAGVDSIGVCTGVHSAELLVNAGAKIVVASLEQIIPVVLEGPVQVA